MDLFFIIVISLIFMGLSGYIGGSIAMIGFGPWTYLMCFGIGVIHGIAGISLMRFLGLI